MQTFSNFAQRLQPKPNVLQVKDVFHIWVYLFTWENFLFFRCCFLLADAFLLAFHLAANDINIVYTSALVKEDVHPHCSHWKQFIVGIFSLLSQSIEFFLYLCIALQYCHVKLLAVGSGWKGFSRHYYFLSKTVNNWLLLVSLDSSCFLRQRAITSSWQTKSDVLLIYPHQGHNTSISFWVLHPCSLLECSSGNAIAWWWHPAIFLVSHPCKALGLQTFSSSILHLNKNFELYWCMFLIDQNTAWQIFILGCWENCICFLCGMWIGTYGTLGPPVVRSWTVLV
jgi:hypothetical protein